MGQPQKRLCSTKSERRPVDSYFISVTGGSWPVKEQTLLLKLVSFLSLHWFRLYTTRALQGQGACYFVKQIEIPNEETLDVIAVDTGSLQDPSNGTGNDQLQWLTSTLEASNSSWRIAVGFHPLVACDENIEQTEAKQKFETLHHEFLKNGVNAYISGHACSNYVHKGGIMHNNNAGPIEKGPYLSFMDNKLVLNKERTTGFLLHRVSSLEIVTYLVSLTGEVVQKITLQQRGRGVM
ncbi:unnamed protein product [Ilex paraguariensis]|uniref:Calcineurin-like phosphoesterase domain-containing protein n=1 Tax=Ilex paraguariensis TaxID=185542 RepID=A0ABC8THU8_9AQUA